MQGAADNRWEAESIPSAYDKWVASEGIPVIRGYHLYDLNEVSLDPWKRKGGKGVFINLVGNEGSADAYICEIEPGGSLRPQRHLYEETIYILSGSGASTVWTDGRAKHTFEWHAGSLFAVPINTWHQHFSVQGDKPARYLGVTNAPLVVNLFHNLDFVFNNNFNFTDRYAGEGDYFSRPGKLLAAEPIKGLAPAWETNFVPDVRAVKLYDLYKRGGGNSSICFELADCTMTAHISEFAVGTYKKAHRHGPGANIVIISGTGYSLMWPEGKPWVKIPWRSGSVLVPPGKWFHQHFNTGSEPARYMAIRWGSQKNIFPALWKADDGSAVGPDQIEYEDEDARVRAMYEEELATRGVASGMDKILGEK